jgi:hypothetical protein
MNCSSFCGRNDEGVRPQAGTGEAQFRRQIRQSRASTMPEPRKLVPACGIPCATHFHAVAQTTSHLPSNPK